jgi:RimJ/RimL family protein N-acetyltransferase
LTIVTPRLRLRLWSDTDRDAFAEMNADPEVMQDLGGPIARAESDAKLDRYRASWGKHGIGRWLVETRDGNFIGYAGILPAHSDHPLGEHYEAAWRLVHSAWGKGYANEASRAALDDAFARLKPSEILAYTAPDNFRSQAVMARLEFIRDEARDFTLSGPRGTWRGLVWFARKPARERPSTPL